jgi:hypothetical protein
LGNPLVDRLPNDGVSGGTTNTSSAKKGKATVKGEGLEQEEMLLAVARKQGMNTDVRKSVFVILMSSEVSSAHKPGQTDS